MIPMFKSRLTATLKTILVTVTKLITSSHSAFLATIHDKQSAVFKMLNLSICILYGPNAHMTDSSFITQLPSLESRVQSV